VSVFRELVGTLIQLAINSLGDFYVMDSCKMLMMKKCVKKCLSAACFVGAVGMVSVHGSESLGIVGKNDWLFLRSELSSPAEAPGKTETISLIGRLNKVFAANGVNMVVTVVPAKARLYAEHLPDTIKLHDYMLSNYESITKALQAAGVAVIDLNTLFMSSPLRNSDPYLFYRLDGHWNFTGAKLAADTLKAGLDANPVLKSALNATSEVAFQRNVEKRKRPSKAGDLIALVPPNSGTFAPEQVTWVRVIRTQEQNEANRMPIGITVQGSSFSQDWTGFVDALRFVLQRDILNVSVPAHIGSWVGMESYLSSDAFQNNVPKLLIWERPEYTMRAPPNFQYQDPRYVSNNTEWLLRASAWAQANCKPSTVTAKLMPVGLAARATNSNDESIVTGATSDNEFIELNFDKPIQKLDYLAARVTVAGSKILTLEASGAGEATRRFTLNYPGDEAPHALKAPLPTNGRGFTKLRIYPGKSQSFGLQGLKVCRQPEDLLN
jgi:alginate O-acetyltransferase complex protein AlgJ